MKKILFIVTFFLFIYAKAAVVFKAAHPLVMRQDDTAALVQHVLANKAKYLHQPLSVLLKDLPYKIKSFVPGRSSRTIGAPYNYAYLYFENSGTVTVKNNNHIHIRAVLVDFEKGIPFAEIWRNAAIDQSAWTASRESYFSEQIISNVRLLE